MVRRSVVAAWVGLVGEEEECPGGALRLLGQVRRKDDSGLDVQVAVALALEPRHPSAGEAECLSRLGPRRDRQQDAALERLDRDLVAEECFLQGQREIAFEVRAAAREPGVGQHADEDDEVAAAGAAPGQLDAGPCLGTLRDLDLEALAVDLDQAGRPVVGLVEGDLGSGLVGGRAWRGPGAGGAGRRVPAGGPGSTEVDPHPRQDVVETHRATRRGRAATGRRTRAVAGHAFAEEDAEEIGELARVGRPELVADIAAGGPVERRAVPSGRAGLADRLPVRTELVVLLALGRIAEDLVGLVDLLELAFGSRIARLGIGVMLPSELAKGLLDLSL